MFFFRRDAGKKVCLPCGHLYGLSCIKKWLQTSSGGKCPLCNTLCAYRDAIPLHARSCASPHQKISSTRHFPFTKQGLVEFKEHERLRFVDAKKMYAEDCDRLIDVLEHQCEVHNRWVALGTQLKDLSKRDEELEQDYALRRQALRQRYDALRRRFDALGRRADVLEQRIDVLNRWLSAYKPNMKYLIQMYKEHFALQKNTEPCVAAAAPTCHKHNLSI
ncbi:zinc finger, RING/FYVE/PHD-type containing protein [Tanacetum coccineum]